jgi:hypothetical protein
LIEASDPPSTNIQHLQHNWTVLPTQPDQRDTRGADEVVAQICNTRLQTTRPPDRVVCQHWKDCGIDSHRTNGRSLWRMRADRHAVIHRLSEAPRLGAPKERGIGHIHTDTQPRNPEQNRKIERSRQSLERVS